GGRDRRVALRTRCDRPLDCTSWTGRLVGPRGLVRFRTRGCVPGAGLSVAHGGSVAAVGAHGPACAPDNGGGAADRDRLAGPGDLPGASVLRSNEGPPPGPRDGRGIDRSGVRQSGGGVVAGGGVHVGLARSLAVPGRAPERSGPSTGASDVPVHLDPVLVGGVGPLRPAASRAWPRRGVRGLR